MFSVLLDIAAPEPILESIGTSGFGAVLGIVLVILVIAAVAVSIILARKKKK